MKTACDVVLVVPGNRKSGAGNGSSPVFERIGVAYLVSAIRDGGYRAEFVHIPQLGYSNEKAVEAICDLNPKILGFSMMFSHTELRGIIDIAVKVKEAQPGVHITIGGPAASVTDINLLESFSFIDSVVRGEGERVLLDLVRRISGNRDWRKTPGISLRAGTGIIRNPGAARITDLDNLPFPDREFIDIERANGRRYSFAVMSSSRGCYGNCNFCCIRTFYRSDTEPTLAWQQRSAENVVAEIEQLSKRKGIRHFVFIDDNFIGPGTRGKRRATEFAQRLIASKLNIGFEVSCRSDDVEKDVFLELKRAGLTGVFLGIESGVQRSLDFFNKKITVEQNIRALEILTALDIPVMGGFIMFDPYTTPKEILANIRFLREHRIAHDYRMAFNTLQVHPNTSLEADLRGRGFDLQPEIEPGTNYVHKYNYSFASRQTDSVFRVISELSRESERRERAVMELAGKYATGVESDLTVSQSPNANLKWKRFMSDAKKLSNESWNMAMQLVEDTCGYLLKNNVEYLSEEEIENRVNECFKRKDLEIFDGKLFSEALQWVSE